RGSGRHRPAVTGELLAQLALGELADARLRERLDEDHVVGQPPAGDARCQPVEDGLAARPRPPLRHPASHRPPPAPPPRQARGGARACPRAWGRPVAGAWSPGGCPIGRFSSSTLEIPPPPLLMTSLERSVIWT